MSTQIVDRRFSEKNKSAVNRSRFINRFKLHIKKAVTEAISKRSITEIEKGEKIIIPSKDIAEPLFRYGLGGIREVVHPYNQEYVEGDKIKKPPMGQGQAGGANNDQSTGSDEFGFEISREEFLTLFFEDLALPDLVKRKFTETKVFTPVRAGFKKTGTPASLDVRRSMRNALARRIAFSGNVEDKGRIPFIDPFDLRYRNIQLQPKSATQAVMFCLMDVSGSMDESRKDLAKRFFILLYLFLTRTYERIELVFIRHHTTAKEVTEHEFFYSRETGGTVVSSALILMMQIIRERYSSSDWNIYGAQASDGDNWNADSPPCADLLISSLMPCVQYFAYIEILPQVHQNLWESYQGVEHRCKNFAMKTVESATDIYPVFRELFRKKV